MSLIADTNNSKTCSAWARSPTVESAPATGCTRPAFCTHSTPVQTLWQPRWDGHPAGFCSRPPSGGGDADANRPPTVHRVRQGLHTRGRMLRLRLPTGPQGLLHSPAVSPRDADDKTTGVRLIWAKT